ncbi:ATP-binding protein [Geodermatophilus sp. URMC 63]
MTGSEGEGDAGSVAGGGHAGSADVDRPAEARTWVRTWAEAAGCPAAVVEELVLLVSEVLVADAARAGAAHGPRRLRAVPGEGGLVVEVGLPAPLLPLPEQPAADDPRARLAVAAAAALSVAVDARPADDGGQSVRIRTRA